jgi:hypothetical protein
MRVVYPTCLTVGTCTIPIERTGRWLPTTVVAKDLQLVHGQCIPGADLLLNVRCGLIFDGHQSECVVLKRRIAVGDVAMDCDRSARVVVPLDGRAVRTNVVQGPLIGKALVGVGFVLADAQPGTTLTPDQLAMVLDGLCGEHLVMGRLVRSRVMDLLDRADGGLGSQPLLVQ